MVFKLDFKNAFNTVHRDKLLQTVKIFSPEYYAFLWQCYRNTSVLLYGEHVINSANGVQQGDSFDPLLFCLAIEALTTSFVLLLNIQYLDDGCLGGSLEEIVSDLQTVTESAGWFGFELNL